MQKRQYILRNDRIRDNAVSLIKSLTISEERLIKITVEDYEENRSLEQNAKLHAMLGELADQTGYRLDEIKSIILIELGHCKHVVDPDGNEYKIPKSTSKMSVKKLSELIEEIYQWSAENGFVLR